MHSLDVAASATNADLIATLQARGVIVHTPAATLIEEVDPERIEAGVEIYPGTTLRGKKTLLRAGTRLGLAGGGLYKDIATGRNVTLYSGFFQDAVFLDGVTIRGHSEVRGGTLLEEGAEGGHHVGFKMTVFLPYVVTGSLVNFCDALFAGGTSRKDHSEIGSTLALYNFTPWGDKFASQFGDVPRGVFMRAPRVFVGGQTQIVSPVKVGFGSVIAAGCPVRRDVPEARLYGEKSVRLNIPFDHQVYGRLRPCLDKTAEYIANLWCLRHWYARVRLPAAAGDAWVEALYARALDQIDAGIQERLTRLDKIVAKLPASIERIRARSVKLMSGARRRVDEQQGLLNGWATQRVHLAREPDVPDWEGTHPLDAIVAAMTEARASTPGLSYIDFITGHLSPELAEQGTGYLQRYLDNFLRRWRERPPAP